MEEKKITTKIIHYCWFGNNPLPSSAENYIKSWKKFFPEYEIKRWDESNFDIKIIPYTYEAYMQKKYAFVSDYARFWILYHYGGLYFDTDVKVIKGMQDIIDQGAFMGRELTFEEALEEKVIGVAPGLGIGSNPYHPFYKEILDHYSKLHFVLEDGSLNQTTVVEYITDLLVRKGLRNIKEIQRVSDIVIYPSDFFCPISPLTLKMIITPNTRTIHYFAGSWIPKNRRVILRFTKKFPKISRCLLMIKHLLDGTRPI